MYVHKCVHRSTQHTQKAIIWNVLSARCFQDVMCETFSGIGGVDIIVDDQLIWIEYQQQYDECMIQVLEKAL